MDMTLLYQIYQAEYDKLFNEIYRDETGASARKELGPRMSKVAFASSFGLIEQETIAKGQEERPRMLAKMTARRQLDYVAPGKQERMLEIIQNPETVKDIVEAGFADLIEEPITASDLQRGTPKAVRLVDFLDNQYHKFKSEGLDSYQAKQKISQIYFGS